MPYNRINIKKAGKPAASITGHLLLLYNNKQHCQIILLATFADKLCLPLYFASKAKCLFNIDNNLCLNSLPQLSCLHKYIRTVSMTVKWYFILNMLLFRVPLRLLRSFTILRVIIWLPWAHLFLMRRIASKTEFST